MKKMFLTLVSLIFIGISCPISAMNYLWGSTKEEETIDQEALERAKKASRDDLLLKQIEKDPKLNLIYWIIKNTGNVMQQRLEKIETKLDGLDQRLKTIEDLKIQSTITDLQQRVNTLESCNLVEKIKKIDEFKKKIDDFDRIIGDNTIKVGTFAETLASHEGRIQLLNERVDERVKEISNQEEKIS